MSSVQQWQCAVGMMREMRDWLLGSLLAEGCHELGTITYRIDLSDSIGGFFEHATITPGIDAETSSLGGASSAGRLSEHLFNQFDQLIKFSG